MTNKVNHLATARDNRAVAISLLENDLSLAWAATVAFYSALHLIEAAFAKNGQHFDNHPARNAHLKSERTLQNIWKHYKPLYDYSLKARYLADENGSAEDLMKRYLGAEGVREQILNHHLRQVEKSVAKILDIPEVFESTDEMKS